MVNLDYRFGHDIRIEISYESVSKDGRCPKIGHFKQDGWDKKSAAAASVSHLHLQDFTGFVRICRLFCEGSSAAQPPGPVEPTPESSSPQSTVLDARSQAEEQNEISSIASNQQAPGPTSTAATDAKLPVCFSQFHDDDQSTADRFQKHPGDEPIKDSRSHVVNSSICSEARTVITPHNHPSQVVPLVSEEGGNDQEIDDTFEVEENEDAEFANFSRAVDVPPLPLPRRTHGSDLEQTTAKPSSLNRTRQNVSTSRTKLHVAGENVATVNGSCGEGLLSQETSSDTDAGSALGVLANVASQTSATKAKVKNIVAKISATPGSAQLGQEQQPLSWGPVLPPSRLHELCSASSVQLSEFEAALAERPEAASTADMNGRLPLHLLGENDCLIRHPHGKQAATAFAVSLMRAYPAAITTTDRYGCTPFCAPIREWMQWVYQTHRKIQATQYKSDATARIMEMISESLASSVECGGGGGSNGDESDRPGESKTGSLLRLSVRSFPSARLFDEVEWCFHMLSVAMDGLGGKDGGFHDFDRRHHQRQVVEDKMARTELATKLVTTLPTLLKTIFLIEDDGGEASKRLLALPIIRRVLLCPESVGPWLTIMMGRKGPPSQRAIDYLHVVSHTTAEDYVGRHRSILPKDVKEYEGLRRDVFQGVGALRGIIVSLLVLPDYEQERAAATPVIWYVMRENLGRPFVVSLVLIDFVLHIVLLVAFRESIDVGTDQVGIDHWVISATCLHYVIRKGSEALSVWNMSTRVFLGYITNLWTIYDIATISCTVAAVVWNEDHPGIYRSGFNTFVLALLWVKVLAFLKIVNRPLSTFIMTILHIMRDLRHFAILLIVILLMFGDMFRIALSTYQDGEFCKENLDELSGPAQDFCSRDFRSSVLRVYSLLLGDFELDDYRETPGMTVIFVIFTLFGVVLMLNLLIAIMTDSYEKAKNNSILIFGRARAAFVANNQALETFLLPQSSPLSGLNLQQNARGVVILVYRILRWLVLLTLLGTAFFAELYLSFALINDLRRQDVIGCIVDVTFLFLLTLALLVAILFALDFMIGECSPPGLRRILNALNRCTGFFTSRIAIRIFGLDPKAKCPAGVDVKDEDKEWAGRLTSMEKRLERRLATKEDLKDEVLALEQRLCEGWPAKGPGRFEI